MAPRNYLKLARANYVPNSIHKLYHLGDKLVLPQIIPIFVHDGEVVFTRDVRILEEEEYRTLLAESESEGRYYNIRHIWSFKPGFPNLVCPHPHGCETLL